jgi:hypothetical protein
MPDSKISALPSATVPLAGTEVLPIVQSSTTDKVTAADLLRQNGQTVTTSNPVLSLAQTWNAGGVTFTGMLFNATNTASAAASKLLDLQTGGVSQFAIRAGDGRIETALSAFNFWVGATRVLNLQANILGLFSDAATISMGAAGDAVLARDAANTLAQRNGTNAQTFRVYNTYTDASNYERGVFDWSTTANNLTIGTQKAGTGATRVINFQVGGAQRLQLGAASATLDVGIIFGTDNTHDIGTLGATRPRHLFTGSNIYPGGVIQWPSSTTITPASGDGTLRLTNNAGTGFTLLQFGGTTSSFPALKRNGAAISVSLADDSGLANLVASTVFATNLRAQSNSGLITLGSADDVILNRDAADALALRNGANAQTFSIYRSYTDASNYSRLRMFLSGSTWNLSAEALGTGSASALSIQSGGNISFASAGTTEQWRINAGNFIALADNTYDIGASGNFRPRTVYIATSLVVPTITTTSHINAGGYILAGSSNVIGWNSRSYMQSPSDGVIKLTNSSDNDFTRLQFGGTTSSFPAIARNATEIDFKLADNSARCGINVGSIASYGGSSAYVATAIPAGGTAGVGFKATSATNFGVFFGSGAPTLSAAKGSLYLRSDGSGTGDRMYVNTDGATAWTAVTTAT